MGNARFITVILAVSISVASAASHATRPAKAGHTGHHGAIAFDARSNAVGFSFDFKTAREANVGALNQCGQPACTVVAHARNGCVALARQGDKIFHAPGATRMEAEVKARAKCKISPGKADAAACELVAWTCTK
jgi:Domain of unknown function (DUF4189)